MSKTTESPLKYVEYAVTLEEVPDEVSLTLTISNCLYRCHGCHSTYLRRDIGQPLQRDLETLISRYARQISCVCLMGEGQNPIELTAALRLIRQRGLKTCLYTGCDSLTPFQTMLPFLNYIKLGRYIEALGGLDQPATNQRFYRVENGYLIDQTHQFQRRTHFP